MADDKKAASRNKRASRRDFLKLAGTGAPAVAVALATTQASARTAAAQEAPSALGLRKTDHVKTYLETARF